MMSTFVYGASQLMLIGCVCFQASGARSFARSAPIKIDTKSAPSHTDRLASFSDCRSENIIATSYAAAGFSYAAQTGHIHCNVCGLTLSGFVTQAYDPLSLHQTYVSSCKFLATTDVGSGESIDRHRYYLLVVGFFKLARCQIFGFVSISAFLNSITRYNWCSRDFPNANPS